MYICFTYIPPSNSLYYTSHEVGFFELLEQDVRYYQQYGKIAIMGDLNARCGDRLDYLHDIYACNDFVQFLDTNDHDDEHLLIDIPHGFSIDKTVNCSGNKLLDLCRIGNLNIVNGRMGDDAGVGSLTYMSSTGCSLIDYAIMSYDFFMLSAILLFMIYILALVTYPFN